MALDFLLRQPERNGKAIARKKRIGFCLNENRKGFCLKSPPIAGKGGIARIAGIVIIDIIDTINTINTIGTIISISLRGRQSRSEVLASKGLEMSSLSEAEGLSS